jgi:HEAT repeat protein
VTLRAAFTVFLLAVSVALVVLVCSTAARRVAGTWLDRRRARVEAAARPALMALLDDAGGEGGARPALGTLGRAERRALDRLAATFLGKLRGEDRATLVAMLEADGTLAQARRHTRSRSAVRRSHAAELLGAAGYAPALWDLARLCTDRRAEVRTVAARALAKLDDPVAIPVLLGTLEPPARLPVSTVAMALARITEDGGPRLRVALAASAPEVRVIAADLLGLHGTVSAADDLAVVLRDDDEAAVRAAAARALGRISSPRSLLALVEATGGDPAPEVRQAAVVALGTMGSPRAVPALRRALEDGEPGVSEGAASALGSLGGKGREVLTLRATAPGPAGRRAAAALARATLAGTAEGRRRGRAA